MTLDVGIGRGRALKKVFGLGSMVSICLEA